MRERCSVVHVASGKNGNFFKAKNGILESKMDDDSPLKVAGSERVKGAKSLSGWRAGPFEILQNASELGFKTNLSQSFRRSI
jgi:hypothetical protein